MTATVATTTTTTTTTARHRSHPLLKATVLGGIVAAVTAMALAAVAHAAGVPLAVDGQAIPLLGFAEMTFVGAVLGGLVVAALNRWSGRARQRFLIIAARSRPRCPASRPWPFRPTPPPSWSLVATHLVAAAIVVPVLVRRAAR